MGRPLSLTLSPLRGARGLEERVASKYRRIEIVFFAMPCLSPLSPLRGARGLRRKLTGKTCVGRGDLGRSFQERTASGEGTRSSLSTSWGEGTKTSGSFAWGNKVVAIFKAGAIH